MKKFIIPLLLCACYPALAQTARQIENIEAFNRLYGYVKYFHPSDEAANLDWDKFAIYGCREVEKCSNPQELQKTLLDLFLPIAPTIKVTLAGDRESFIRKELLPADTTNFKVVTWQHSGLGAGSANPQSPYTSSRLNRKTIGSADRGFSTITSSADITQYRGREFRLVADVSLLEGPGTAHLWARVDKPDNKFGFFDNMENRPITSAKWSTYEITGIVDSDAVNFMFGCFLKKGGKLMVDNLNLSIRESKEWKVIYTNSFESDPLNVVPKSVSAYKVSGFKTYVTNAQASEGKKSVVIETERSEKEYGLLFERYCRVGEYVKKDIGSELKAIIPLAVYGNDSVTYPAANPEKLSALKELLKNLPANPETNIHTRLGDIIITWNVFQHFYPYFDITKTDWNAALRSAIKDAYADTSAYDFLKTLRKLTAQLKDGHVNVNNPGTYANESYFPPIQWEWVENKLVITKVLDSNLPIKAGDIVTAIDQLPADQYFQQVNQYISAATPGWLHYRAQTNSLVGQQGSKVLLTMLDAGNIRKELSLTRSMSTSEYHNHFRNEGGEPISTVAEGIYYINIGKASMEQIRNRLTDFQQAKALICDLRGYPNSNHELIGHLLQQKDTSQRWMRVPQIIYPDQENITGYREMGWEMKPLQPHLSAKVYFILDGRAISYAESYMSFIEHYNLATIIGQPSAGTNGNVNTFSLPGSYRVSWTGMKVFKHDGSALHGVGILPDVYVEKTILGVRENRDEFLDKAIEMATQFQVKVKD